MSDKIFDAVMRNASLRLSELSDDYVIAVSDSNTNNFVVLIHGDPNMALKLGQAIQLRAMEVKERNDFQDFGS